MEVWKDVVGYEGLYKVSTNGRIRSLDRIIPSKAGSRMTRYGKVLSPAITKAGYHLMTFVNHDTVRAQYLIHRVIALTFLTNPDNFPQVNHINGIKTDNRPANLEWCTGSHNSLHALKLGLSTIPDNKGKFNRGNSKPVLQIDINGTVIKRWPSAMEACRILNIKCSGVITNVCKGRQVTAAKYKWEFA